MAQARRARVDKALEFPFDLGALFLASGRFPSRRICARLPHLWRLNLRKSPRLVLTGEHGLAFGPLARSAAKWFIAEEARCRTAPWWSGGRWLTECWPECFRSPRRDAGAKWMETTGSNRFGCFRPARAGCME